MIKQNLARIRECLPSSVLILPAVKGRGYKNFEALQEVGLTTVGENRVQEFLAHYETLKDASLFKWHFIGQLQTNKVKYLIGKIELIHSLDRVSLAKEINKLSERQRITTDCLIELNIINEPNKGGIPLDRENIFESGKKAIEDFITQIAIFKNIRIRGLMAVMPNTTEMELEKYYFELGKLYTHFKEGKNFDILSAGMSDDYKTAIKHGANLIRLGRTLFDPASK